MWVELSDVFPEEIKELIYNALCKEKVVIIKEDISVYPSTGCNSTDPRDYKMHDISKHVIIYPAKYPKWHRCIRLKTLFKWLKIKTTDKEFDRLLLLYRRNILKQHLSNITGGQTTLFDL